MLINVQTKNHQDNMNVGDEKWSFSGTSSFSLNKLENTPVPYQLVITFLSVDLTETVNALHILFNWNKPLADS